MRLYLRLASDEAGFDAAGMPELRQWLISRSPVVLDQPPAWVDARAGAGGGAPGSLGSGGPMNALQTVLEIAVDAVAVGQLLLAIAQWRRAERKPTLTVSTEPDTGGYRIESTDPQAVAELVRALHGS